MNIAAVVMAHPARRAQAEHLAATLGAHVAWDTNNDEWTTGARALGMYEDTTTHVIVLQDDAVPVRDFTHHAARAIAEHPTEPISFYLGRSYPATYQRRIMQATLQAADEGAAWLSCEEMLHGVGIALPTADVPRLLAWCRGRREPYDQRIGKWYREQHRRILYTWPSLVDHADGEPLVQARPDRRPRTRPRVAWATGPATWWDTPVIPI